MEHNLTPEELEKRKEINKKILKYFGYALIGVIPFVMIIKSIVGPSFKVNSSISKSETMEENVIISGTTPDDGILKINGDVIESNDNKFSINIPLNIGKNIINVSFESKDLNEQKEIEIFRTNERLEKIRKQFNPFDGSHENLSKLIKRNMNDRSSFEHVESRYWEKGDQILVQTKFRGKNSFGAIVLNTVKATFDLDGNLIEIVEQ